MKNDISEIFKYTLYRDSLYYGELLYWYDIVQTSYYELAMFQKFITIYVNNKQKHNQYWLVNYQNRLQANYFVFVKYDLGNNDLTTIRYLLYIHYKTRENVI